MSKKEYQYDLPNDHELLTFFYLSRHILIP